MSDINPIYLAPDADLVSVAFRVDELVRAASKIAEDCERLGDDADAALTAVYSILEMLKDLTQPLSARLFDQSRR